MKLHYGWKEQGNGTKRNISPTYFYEETNTLSAQFHRQLGYWNECKKQLIYCLLLQIIQLHYSMTKTHAQADELLRSVMKGRMSLKNKCLLMLISGIWQIMEIFFSFLFSSFTVSVVFKAEICHSSALRSVHVVCLLIVSFFFPRLAAEWAGLVERLSKARGSLRSLTFLEYGLLCG